ncbi:MAG: hypothetical protein JWR18_3386 [Segetibacter sp.]|jgi:hypothetical protein|nr:hypothetical protein [Segetibacter sp.]
MKEIIINVPEDAVEFVEEFVERIGGTVVEGDGEKKQKPKSKRKTAKPKPLDFFGTWKDIPLDPINYRKDLWRKIPEL